MLNLKKLNWKNIFFLLGNILIILTTFVLIWVIPKLDFDSENVNKKIQDMESTIKHNEAGIQSFESQQNLSENQFAILKLMEGLKLNNSKEYKELYYLYLRTNQIALMSLANIRIGELTDEDINKFKEIWKQMNFEQLNQEELKDGMKTAEKINGLIEEKKDREEQEMQIKKERLIIIFWAGILQVLGLLLLALDNFLSRTKLSNSMP